MEKLGVAAPETVLSLCAVLEIDPSDVLLRQTSILDHLPIPLRLIFAVAFLGMAVGAGATYLFVG